MDKTVNSRDLLSFYAPIISAASLLKAPVGFPLFLNILMPLAGMLHFIITLRFRSIFFPMLIFCGVAFLGGIYNQIDAPSHIRILQIVGLVLFANYVSLINSSYLINRTVLYSTIVFSIVFCLELVTGASGSRHLDIFGPLSGSLQPILAATRVPRFEGVYGEWNFSAAAVSMVAVLALLAKMRVSFVVLVVILAGFVSRGGFGAVILAFMVYLVGRINLRVSALISMAFVSVFAAFPIIVTLFNLSIDDLLRGEIGYYTSRRFIHWINFLDFGWSNPLFGVGYFSGIDYYQSTVTDWVFGIYSFIGGAQYQEAHNLFIDVFGELGVICYSILAFFVTKLAYVCLRRAPELGPLFVCLTVLYLNLSGISDWSFWIAIGLSVSYASSVERVPNLAEKTVDTERGYLIPHPAR